MKKRSLFLTRMLVWGTIVVSLLLFMGKVFCEGTSDSLIASELSVELEKIVITPLGTEQSYGEISRNMDVLRREDLETIYSQNVTKSLDRLPSVSVSDYGSLGALKTIKLRGSTAEQVLVLMDSRPINNPRSGQPELHQIPVDTIEKIEVIKGPASSVYGSSAIGGVVNIITKAPSKKPKTVIESGFGSFKAFHESFSNSATIKEFGYFFNYTYDSSLGHRDNSQYRSHNWTTKLDYRVSESNKLFFNAGYFEDEAGTPGTVSAPDLDDFQFDFKDYLDMGWSAEIFDGANIKLRGYQDVERMEFVESYNPLRKNSARSKVRGVMFQYNQRFLDFYKIIAGFDGKDNKINSSTAGKHRYVVRSPFLQNEISIGKDWNLNLGARWDDYSNFKKESTQNAGVAFKFSDYGKLRVNYAKGFRAPTFNDLYWPSSGSSSGNPNLCPEKGWTYEGGFDIEYPNGLEITATYFTSRMKDLISWARGDDRIWRPSNVNSARIDGLEFKTVILLAECLKMDFGYSYLNALDVNRDKYLTYRAKNKFDFGLDYRFKELDVRIWGQSLGRRYDDVSNSQMLKEDLIMYFDASYRINNNLTTFISIDNMFNKKYQRVLGYPMPGFALNGGLKLDF